MPFYNPPESIPFDSPPPYRLLESVTQSESDDSAEFPPDPWDYDADSRLGLGIPAHNPQLPYSIILLIA